MKPSDPQTFGTVAGIALLEGNIPARRATAIDPAIALRFE